MSIAAGRLLRLLGLLQQHREWTGPMLSAELGVSTRTVRQDIESLRELGYPIHAQAGVGGGYRLGAGTTLPPLLLDDDEAVAIAVGLRTTAGATLSGIERASLSALTKLDQVLPSRLRRRVDTLGAHLQPLAGGGPPVSTDLLVQIAGACRDRHRLRFDYHTRAERQARRRVEPHEVVQLGRFWYLVAFDEGRADWRTFRLDRIVSTPVHDRRFARREPPPGGFAQHVARYRSPDQTRHQAEIVLHASLEIARQHVPPTHGTLSALTDQRTLLRTEGAWLGALAIHVALTGLTFEVRSPPELLHEIVQIAERFSQAETLSRHTSLPPPT